MTCECGNTITANVVVVEIEKIQWRLSGGTYADAPEPPNSIYVAKDAQVDFRASIKPSGASWPSGKPAWTGATPNTPPDTASVTFSSVGSQTVTCECGNSKSVNVVVCDKIKISLGNSANLSSCIVGKVYVPTYWGGTLKFTGSSVELFYTNGSDLDINTATSVIKGDMNDYRVAQGSSYTVPIEKYKWYYVKITEPTMTAVTATFEQSKDVGDTGRKPWTCAWYPTSEESNPNLYDTDGCLDKYDAAYSSNNRKSKDREKRNLYKGGDYIRKAELVEANAEMTVGYDFNNADADDDPWTGWTENIAWNFWDHTKSPPDNNWTYDTDNDGSLLDEGDQDTNDIVDVGWWGHCVEAAAVVVSENEPKNDVTINNITFTAEDQKGLLVALYHGHSQPGSKGPDLKPHAWHAMLEERLLNVSPEDGSPIPKMFACDVYNSGPGVDVVWNHPIYKIEKAEYKEKPGQTDEKIIEVKCEVKYWDNGANSLYYWYNITYGTDGLAASSENSDWKEHPSASTNYKEPDSVYAPILQTTIGGFWGGQMNYNEIRAIVPAPTPAP